MGVPIPLPPENPALRQRVRAGGGCLVALAVALIDADLYRDLILQAPIALSIAAGSR